MQDQLVQQLQSRSSVAIGQLYDAYGAALFGVVLRIVGSKELAEQVLQDTFLKAWKNGESYDPSKGQLFTWLVNIARNTAIDATRSAHFKNQKHTSDITTLYQQPDSGAMNPEHVGVRELIEKLDEKYRKLVDLVYFQGYTQEEVAETTGIPLGTIKTRLRYAITELRRYFIFIWFFMQ